MQQQKQQHDTQNTSPARLTCMNKALQGCLNGERAGEGGQRVRLGGGEGGSAEKRGGGEIFESWDGAFQALS